MTDPTEPLLRVERGQLDPEELAALVVVLLARADAGRGRDPASLPRHRTAHRRPAPLPAFRPARSWQATPL